MQIKEVHGEYITFTSIYAINKFIGQVKYDGFRKSNQYTALNKDGERIKDVATEEEAQLLVWNAAAGYGIVPVKNENGPDNV